MSWARRDRRGDPIGHDVIVSFSLGGPLVERSANGLVVAMEPIGGLYLLDRYDKNERGQVIQEHGSIENPDFAARRRELVEQR